jgi:hypothetical protein
LQNKYAPIVIFAYKRAEHLIKVLSALSRNQLAIYSHLIIYCDGPKNTTEVFECEKVYDIACNVRGFCTVKVIKRDNNIGLANSLISGVSDVLNIYDRAIIIEDDIFVGDYFLDYMNNALNIYGNNYNVAAIHGYMYPVRVVLPNTFFLKGADCWGWATWRRAWNCFEPNGNKLLEKLIANNLTKEFDLNGAYPYTKMLKDQIAGKNNSWAIRWQASVFLNNMYTLYPGKSLVVNIGHDNSGTHSGTTDIFNVEVYQKQINVEKQKVEECEEALNAVIKYYRGIRWPPRRLYRFASKYISNAKRLLYWNRN